MSAMERLQIYHTPTEAGGSTAPDARDAPWVLVVDDELVVRDLLQRFLALEGYRVVCAADGFEALEALRAHPGVFRLVILDVLMPRMDGYEAFQEIRAMHLDMPVIAMSGFAPGERVAEIIAQPGTGFIAKPFVLGDVLVKVESMLGHAVRPRSTWLTEPSSSPGRLEGITD